MKRGSVELNEQRWLFILTILGKVQIEPSLKKAVTEPIVSQLAEQGFGEKELREAAGD